MTKIRKKQQQPTSDADNIDTEDDTSDVVKEKRQLPTTSALPACNSDTPMEIDGDDENDANDQPPVEDDNDDFLDTLEILPLESCVADESNKKGRLIITKISNEYFKSYAETQILGPFHKSFTAIVGPNGSGKSNVIDAMLFVFGFRASRIRCKKTSTLIHNSQAYQDVDSCKVTVHFARILDTSADSFEVVSGSEFTVSRVGYRDNKSTYSVNGRTVQCKEVEKLLKSHGIDLVHNRFLILQGEVENISLMKPKAQTEHDEGILEYLEDIIGTKRYNLPIQQLAASIEKLNTRRAEKLNRVKLVEKEKDELSSAKNEAVAYLKMKNEACVLKYKVYSHQIYQCELNLSSADEEYQTAKKCLEEFNERQKTITDTLEQVKADRKQISKEHEVCEKNLEECGSNIERLNAEYEESKQLKVQAEKKMDKANKTLEVEREKLENLSKEPEEKQEEIAELEQRKKELEQEIKEAEKQKKATEPEVTEECQPLCAERDNKQKSELHQLQTKKDAAKAEKELAENELQVYLQTHEGAKTDLDSACTALERCRDMLKEKRKSVKELECELPGLKSEKVRIEADLNTAAEECKKLSKELEANERVFAEAKSEMKAISKQNTVLAALVRAQHKGHLQGICGRLGDLGVIDSRYDRAISTTCSDLDSIVVESDEDGKRCIQYMKDKQLGKANFICMTQMNVWAKYVKEKIRTPENAPRLFDQIQVDDERMLLPFYFALRDTLVADDMTQARRLAFGGRTRFRVVTLEGAAIEKSGSMTSAGRGSTGRMGVSAGGGGSRQRAAAPTACRYSEEEVRRMDVACEEMRQRLHGLGADRRRLDGELQGVTQRLARIQPNIDICRKEVQGLVAEEKRGKELIRSKEAEVERTAPDEGRVAVLEGVVEQKLTAFTKVNEKYSKVEVEVKKLQVAIDKLRQDKLGPYEQTIKQCKANLDKVKKNINSAKAAINLAKRSYKKCSDLISSSEQDIAEAERDMKKSDDRSAKLYDDQVEMVLLKKEKQEQLAKLEADLKEKQEKLEEVESVMRSLEKDVVDVQEAYEKAKGRVDDINAKIKHSTVKRSHLELAEIAVSDDSSLETVTQFPTLTVDEVKDMQLEYLNFELEKLETDLEKRNPNLGAIDAYNEKLSVFLARVKELDEVSEKRNARRSKYERFKKSRCEEFDAGFRVINGKLKEMYRMITLGGDAELEYVDSMDPFSEGVVFSVRPPKKSWKNISNLSGGEKTLSSLALVFALHHYKPTPFYVMDEIDAALDFKNVSIVANYIKERTRDAQFIIISLRNNMFEIADRLVGIYKTDDQTKTVSVMAKHFAVISAPPPPPPPAPFPVTAPQTAPDQCDSNILTTVADTSQHPVPVAMST